MKIIIDSNRVIASLMKRSTTREILFDNYFEFYAPSFIKSEIFKYEKEIKTKSNLTEEDFNLLLNLVFSNITIISIDEYEIFLKESSSELMDQKDIPYIAVCLFLNADGIWSHDLHFNKQNKCKVFTNLDMLKMSGKSDNY